MSSERTRTFLIEQTAKKYKKIMGIGAIMILVSPLVFVLGLGIASRAEGALSSLGSLIIVGSPVLFLAGLGVFMVGRGKQWWNHD